MVGRGGFLLADGGRDHPATTLGAKQDSPGEFPKAIPVLAMALVVPDGVPGGVYPLAGYAGVGYGHGYPLRAWFVSNLDLASVAPPFWSAHRHLFARVAAAIEPPDAVTLLRVEPACHVRGDQYRHLLECVRAVHVVLYRLAYVLGAPVRAAGGRPYALAVEGEACGAHGMALRAYHAEDARDYLHALLVHDVVIAGLVVAEPVGRTVHGDHFALPRLLESRHPYRSESASCNRIPQTPGGAGSGRRAHERTYRGPELVSQRGRH